VPPGPAGELPRPVVVIMSKATGIFARPGGLPVALPDELERRRLVERLDARWLHPVTVVVAGAGFGKSTLLAHALRANALEPRGIDIWYSCTPGDVDADRLGADLLEAVGVDRRRPDLAGQLVDVLAEYSPIDVCLVLDDAHEIRTGTSGADLIDRLVRRLPANAHLVLAARHTPPGALARLRAADGIVEIGQDDLMFTRAETKLLADRLGRDAGVAAQLGGWPALVRLALTARPDVAVDFVREEVLDGLSVPQRHALFALSTLGYADAARVRQVVSADVDLRRLAASVPLVTRTEDDRFRAHELWSATLLHILEPSETVDLRARVISRLMEDGDLARAGAIAVAHHDLDALAHVSLAMISGTISALPLDTVRPWGRLLRRDRPDAPETRLMNAVERHAVDFTDAGIDADVDAAAAAFRSVGRHDGEVVALAVGTITAHSRGDVGRLLALAERAAAVPGAREHPIVNFAVHSIAAMAAEMGGDVERALDELGQAGIDDLPPALGMVAGRLQIHCLLIGGRADDAVDVARKLLARTEDKAATYLWAISRWMSGEPSDLVALGRPEVDVPAINSRDAFVRRTLVAGLLASTGRRDAVHRLVDGRATGAPANTRDAVLDAVARALVCLADRDEVGATAVVAAVVAAHRDSPILDQHLRRFLPIGYVLIPELRDRWDDATLAPTHAKARATSRLLVDLRSGRRVTATDVDPGQVFTALPLTWSTELACRLHAHRHPIGGRFAAWLVDHVPETARAELRELADGDVDDVRRAATELLARLPAMPSEQLEIGVLGPMQVAFGGVSVDPSELRRARVRTLLALLVVHGKLSRDRATDLLWPDRDGRNGARNLRVTLTYLRQLLEPGRPTGEASFHLRADGATIALHRSDHLVVDLWEVQRLVDEATASRAGGDTDRTIALLSTATSRWRGEPLCDLGSVAGEEHEIEHARLLHLGATLDLGELRLARGQMAHASLEAERALTVDPYSERAHRLAIAAALHAHDQERANVAVERTVAMLDEFGFDPEPATKILLRQAG
jgi:LuxR family maltose regulon positive regulatory protein